MPKIPVLRPSLPPAQSLGPWLSKIDENHWYSNFGPLESELRGRFGAMAGLSKDNVGLFSSGTDALAIALRGLAPPTGLCLVPAWTHVGTATAIQAAGLKPFFVDCDRSTWALSPDVIRRKAHETGAVAVVYIAPFGAAFDYTAWDEFASSSGVPVVIDAAAGFDFVVGQGKAIRWGRTPVMLSLHATKVFGVGEGGALFSADSKLIRAAQQRSNFGIWEQQPSEDAFANAKFSEYAAAVGLAGLDLWPTRRTEMLGLASRLVAALSPHGIEFAPGFGGPVVSSTCMISVPGHSVAELEIVLNAVNIETRRWWRSGVHDLRAFRACPRDPLPVTESLSGHFLGVPFYPKMPNQYALALIDTLTALCR